MDTSFYTKEKYQVFTLEEWKNFSGILPSGRPNLDRNDGYGLWAWTNSNKKLFDLKLSKHPILYVHGNQNVFLKPPETYTTHVIWYHHFDLNDMLFLEKYCNDIPVKWFKYLQFLYRHQEKFLLNDPDGKFKRNIDFCKEHFIQHTL